MRLSPNDVVVAEALESLKAFFDVVEQTLQQQAYVAGDEFTLVDIYYIPLVQILFMMGHGDFVLGRAAVNGWWNRCMNRPAISQMFEPDKKAGDAGGR